MLFFFGFIVWGYIYLDKTYFFEINACVNNGWGWNDIENTCKTWDDIEQCVKKNGVWIEEENTCDYGDVLNK